MPHTLAFGLYQGTTAGDYADFQDSSGYYTVSVDFGDDTIQYSEAYGREVRTISIQLELKSSSYDTTIALGRKLIRYLESTKNTYKQFGGNIPSRYDGINLEGQAAVLTWKQVNATNTMYFDVLDGTWQTNPNSPLTAEDGLNQKISGVLTLLCNANARGDKRYISNMVRAGDFCRPFNLTSTYNLDNGWSTSGTWNEASGSVFGGYINSPAGSTAVAQSPGQAVTYLTSSANVTAQIWYKGTSITANAVLQGFSGGSWSTIDTFWTVSATTAIVWTQASKLYTAATYAAYSSLRVVVNKTSSGSDLSFTGAGLFPNCPGGSTPVEMISQNSNNSTAIVNVYNVQGDAPTEFELFMNTGSTSAKTLVIGMQPNRDSNLADYAPIGLMDYVVTTSVTSTSGVTLWGVLGQALTSGGTSSTLALTTNPHPYTVQVDRFNRKYRAFLYYAANDSAAITQIKLNLLDENRPYTVSVPQTYTGVTTPTASQYRLFDLGDFFFSRPGSGFVDQLEIISSYLTTAPGIVVTHSSNANLRGAVSGVLLVPAESMAVIEAGSTAFPGGVDGSGYSSYTILTTKPRSPKAVIAKGQFITGGNPLLTNVYDISAISATAYLKGGDFKLDPNYNALNQSGIVSYYSSTTFVILALVRDATYPNLYSVATSNISPPMGIGYTPKYRFVGGY